MCITLTGAPEKMANLLKKPDNKLYAQQWENCKVENAESRKVENARYTPVVEMPQEKFRHFLAPPPRTALATAKRKEVSLDTDCLLVLLFLFLVCACSRQPFHVLSVSVIGHNPSEDMRLEQFFERK